MAVDLSKVGERLRLKPKPGKAPHYQRLRGGAFLGFRPDSQTWVARVRDDSGRYQTKSLGDYGTLPANDRFGAARRDAETWADKVESGGLSESKIETVADACETYLKVISDGEGIAAGVFRRHVYSDRLSKVKLDKLRRHHLREWRQRLEAAPAALTRDKLKSHTKPRAKSTINRDMSPLRAALRRVLPAGAPGTDAAWQEALLPFRSADGRRTLYLDKSERRKLVEAASPNAAPFLQGLCMLPLRPGALAALTVAHFDKRTRTLTIGTDKAGRLRRITLPSVTAEFLAAAATDKLPGAFLFSIRERHEWGDAIKAAAKVAGLPAATCAYTLRHSTITDLVIVGLPLLQIAQISGTSAAMIERHYGHLVGDAAEAALAKLA
jgi:integrase